MVEFPWLFAGRPVSIDSDEGWKNSSRHYISNIPLPIMLAQTRFAAVRSVWKGGKTRPYCQQKFLSLFIVTPAGLCRWWGREQDNSGDRFRSGMKIYGSSAQFLQ